MSIDGELISQRGISSEKFIEKLSQKIDEKLANLKCSVQSNSGKRRRIPDRQIQYVILALVIFEISQLLVNFLTELSPKWRAGCPCCSCCQ